MQQRPELPAPFPAGPVTSTVFTPKLSFTAPAGYTEYADVPQAFGVQTALPAATQAGS